MKTFFVRQAGDLMGQRFLDENRALDLAKELSSVAPMQFYIISDMVDGLVSGIHSIWYQGKRFTPHSYVEQLEARLEDGNKQVGKMLVEMGQIVHYKQAINIDDSKDIKPYCGAENLAVWMHSTRVPELVTCPDCLRILRETENYLSSEIREELTPPDLPERPTIPTYSETTKRG